MKIVRNAVDDTDNLECPEVVIAKNFYDHHHATLIAKLLNLEQSDGAGSYVYRVVPDSYKCRGVLSDEISE